MGLAIILGPIILLLLTTKLPLSKLETVSRGNVYTRTKAKEREGPYFRMC